MRPDPISILESVYRLDGSEEEWLARALDSARPSLDRGLGVQGWTYRIDPGGHTLRTALMRGAPPGVHERLLAHSEAASHDPDVRDWLAEAYASGPVGTLLGPKRRGREMTPSVIGHFRTLEQLGAGDILRLSVHDHEGFGVGIGALVPVGKRPRLESKPTLARIATHLRTALRARTRQSAVEAVLEADGRLAHAEEAANARATREALREATRAIDRARGRMRARDPEAAVALWCGLVEGTWTLVDQHESDGRRYVVARRNEPRSRELLPGLSREETVCLLSAAMGHAQKLLSYELGLSEPQISRTLKRAMQKLGIASKRELAGWFAAMLDAQAAKAEPLEGRA